MKPAAIIVFTLSLLSKSIFSCDCVLSTTVFDTLSQGVVERSIYWDGMIDPASVDTSYSEEFLADLQARYDSSEFVFVGTVDSFYQEPITPQDTIIIIGQNLREHVRVRFDKVYKGFLVEGGSRWFTINLGLMTSCDYGYGSLDGHSFLNYSAKVDTITDLNIYPHVACSPVRGILFSNDVIDYHIYPGLTLTVAEATNSTSNISPAFYSASPGIKAFYIGDNGIIRLPVTPGKSTVSIYDISGKRVKTLFNADGLPLVQGADVPKGIYLIK